MSLSENLSQQKLQEILMDIYYKGNEAENISLKDLIEDIKQQILQQEFPIKKG